MDQETAVERLCEWAAQVMKRWDADDQTLTDSEREAAEHWQALNSWLRRGGALPIDWR